MARRPSSSNSFFDTHIRLNVSKDAKIEPPIQVEYNRSCGADICTKIDESDSIGIFFKREKNFCLP